MQIRDFLLPFGYRFGLYKLSFCCQVAGYAEAGFGVGCFQDLLQHGVVAERRFNKQLCLVILYRQVLQFLDLLTALCLINRQIAMKSKALSVKA